MKSLKNSLLEHAGAQRPIAHGVGRRKAAVARVWLRHGKSGITVNGRTHTEYFDTDVERDTLLVPFSAVPTASGFSVEVTVYGGGKMAQADAIKLGISRALVEMDNAHRPALRENGLLTVDSRVKERKKYGQKAARRKFQFVKR
jgi:small subunit ribosomal protein S9